jgi:hypothetical protein
MFGTGHALSLGKRMAVRWQYILCWPAYIIEFPIYICIICAYNCIGLYGFGEGGEATAAPVGGLRFKDRSASVMHGTEYCCAGAFSGLLYLESV